MAKKEKWGIPTGRLLDSGCVVIEIKKISNHPVTEPGNDAMDRYKIIYKKKIYQLVDLNGELKLLFVAKQKKK